MTAASEVQPAARDVPIDQAQTVSRLRVWRRFVAAFVLGLLFALLAAGAALLAYDLQYDGRVLPGVRVGGTDLSGLDRAQATAALATAYGGYGDGRVLIRTIAGDVAVDYAAFSRRPDVDTLVDAALLAGREGTIPERALAEVRLAKDGRALEPEVILDEAALRSEIARALAPLEERPIDAQIGMGPTGIRILHGRPGRTFDVAAVNAGALATVGSIDAPAEIELDAAAIPIPPVRGDDVVLQAQREAERAIRPLVVSAIKQEWKIPASRVRSWITFTTLPDGSVRPYIDATAIPDSLRKIKRVVDRKPLSAAYLRSKSGTIVGVQAGHNGRRLDLEATTAAIVAELEQRAAGGTAATVEAAIVRRDPKVTTAEATKRAPLMTRLGLWQTYFPIGERNYFGANIWLPAQIIDGTVLRPGQRFEWWGALGPVTTARGFGLGGFIAGDHTDPTGAMGGGMCSASTTLFNAALRAGLAMGARDNHRYYIERYPLGLDATVSNVQTMTFTNDMDTPILIRGFRIKGAGDRGWVRFEIWGVDDGRTVSIGTPVVRNVRKATTKTVYVNTLMPGEREQTEYPANGMDVAVTRTVRDRTGRLLHRDTYRSPYQLWNGRIEVGR
jgi:vancomycin resistance protein YoaR